MYILSLIHIYGKKEPYTTSEIIAGCAEVTHHTIQELSLIHIYFGQPHPEGYRKALRLMKQAEKFGRPVVTFINTAGAYPGVGAEERGQGEAIARNLMEMSDLKVPIIAIIIGEGGSGGALALAVADKVWMLENTVYSILSPEGFATILWKDGSRSEEAAELMKITSGELLDVYKRQSCRCRGLGD